MMLDLYDWEIGVACSLCSICTPSKPAVAELRDAQVGPVCAECMIDLLRAERVARDAFMVGEVSR